MGNLTIELVLPSLLIVPAMGLLSAVRSQSGLGAEIRRKALHIGVGTAALAFPALLREPLTVIAALSLVVGWMLAVRFVPALKDRFGCVLHGVGRLSWGEIWFAASIALLLLADGGHAALYAAPLLVLTYSDALAAIVGRAWPLGRLPGRLSGKTMAGAAAFVVSAFLVTAVTLSLTTDMHAVAVSATAIAVSLGACLAEMLSRRGFDNFTVPAAAWLVLFPILNGYPL